MNSQGKHHNCVIYLTYVKLSIDFNHIYASIITNVKFHWNSFAIRKEARELSCVGLCFSCCSGSPIPSITY